MAQLEPKDRAVQMSQHLFSELAERKANDPMLQKVILCGPCDFSQTLGDRGLL